MCIYSFEIEELHFETKSKIYLNKSYIVIDQIFDTRVNIKRTKVSDNTA